MIHPLVLMFVWLGFASLCLARARHQRDLLGRNLSVAGMTWLRRGGTISLLLALLIAGYGLGWVKGTVEWIGQLSIGALLTMMVLTYRTGRKSRPE